MNKVDNVLLFAAVAINIVLTAALMSWTWQCKQDLKYNRDFVERIESTMGQ